MSKPLPPSATDRTTPPWYRQGWPWALILGPALVVVACIITTWLAIRTTDPVVVDDYYRAGLAVNRSLEREQAASRLGLKAHLQFAGDGGLTLVLEAAGEPAWPDAVQLTLAHPARDQRDRVLTLHIAAGDGRRAEYRADARFVPEAVSYHLLLQDADGHWRLSGRANPTLQPAVVLAAAPAQP